MYRNLYNKVIRAARKLFYEKELIRFQSDLKQTWSIIKQAINKNQCKSSNIHSLKIDGVIIDDPKLMADNFNKFFTSMPSDIVYSINPVDPVHVPDFARYFFQNPPDADTPIFNLTNNPISLNEIIEATKLLQPKKSQDMNGLSLFFIKKSSTT
jgi:hypothetical protein